jgi:glycerol-3-phosphate acyltransferase PlsY
MIPLSQIIWPIGAYLLGSIPFGLLLARCKGIDLRKHGSGNIGATNVARVMGKGWWGILTLTADLAKGLLPVLGCMWAMAGAADLDFWIACTGLSAVLGHCYSIFLGFRGGKGVATAAGVFLGVCPCAIGIAVITFVIALKKWGYVSVGSLAASVLTPILIHFFCPAPELELMAWGTACIIWVRHKDNIKRLMRGEEKGWKKGSPLPNS